MKTVAKVLPDTGDRAFVLFWATMVFIAALMSIIPGSALATAVDEDVVKGDTGMILSAGLVQVKNPTPITTIPGTDGRWYSRFSYGDMCEVGRGDTVVVVAIDRERILLRTQTIGSLPDSHECIDGVLFFTTKSGFIEMKEEYQRQIIEKQARVARDQEKALKQAEEIEYIKRLLGE